MKVASLVLACLCGLAVAVPAPVEDVMLSEYDDGNQVMLNAFVKGQRALIAEFKVATLMVANSVMPGFDFDVSINTTVAHPNTNAICPNPPKAFENFIEYQFYQWVQLLHNLVEGISYSGVMIGNSITNQREFSVCCTPWRGVYRLVSPRKTRFFTTRWCFSQR